MSIKETTNDWQKACDGILNRFMVMGYSKLVIDKYFGIYKHLLLFLTQRRLIDQPIDKKHIDAFLRFYEKPSPTAKTKRFHVCALRRLLEFHQRGSFDIRQRTTNPVVIPASFESILAEYKEYRDTKIISTSIRSAKEHLSDIRHFLHFLSERRIFSIHKIRFDDVHAFIKASPKLSPGRISNRACAVRSFFRFLIEMKNGPSSLLGFVPTIRTAGSFRLASIWPKKTVKKLLSAIDRKTGIGKRDYAITEWHFLI